eukprot:TRINITY_DN3334_c0_g1_i5.p1 TRINITY_DN3334_c0_g1~~TRINITY_DN3334_c0_g1_i5.p1  ORF type:complete len:237 (+),score=31.87 TRINITY_DN3334_c0_g1_i5:83-793(+)
MALLRVFIMSMIVVALAALGRLDVRSIYSFALPPLPKFKLRPTSVHGDQGSVVLPELLRTSIPSSPTSIAWDPTCVTISCDGSCDGTSSGWGFTVAKHDCLQLEDYCGPTTLDSSSFLFIGADVHTNNVGELSAIFFALCWVADYHVPGQSYVLEYDSVYAAQVVQRLSRARLNLTLVLRARSAFDSAGNLVDWQKVAAHRGHFLNERADTLAKLGAGGTSLGAAACSRWAQRFRR